MHALRPPGFFCLGGFFVCSNVANTSAHHVLLRQNNQVFSEIFMENGMTDIQYANQPPSKEKFIASQEEYSLTLPNLPKTVSYHFPFIALLGGAGGIGSSAIAYATLQLYKQASEQAAACHIRLDRTSDFILANSACEGLGDPEKKQMRSEIIRKLFE